jgi:formate dehydrogenase iron-sulfur subunit
MACKNWNQNGASMTKNTGSHQNPPDLDGNTFKLVRFSEVDADGRVAWYFFADQCRHCLVPPCKDTIDGYGSGGAFQDEATGAVYYTPKAKEAPFEEVRSSCPYDIPRQAANGNLVKCTMCIDRISNGLLPACVKICPTGAMNFGDRDAMMALANERLATTKKTSPKAALLDANDVRVIYLVVDDPKKYHKNAVASLPRGIVHKLASRILSKPSDGQRIEGARV